MVSGTSEENMVQLFISKNGEQVWGKENLKVVDGYFEREIPPLISGELYLLTVKHGTIGGESESKEFHYTGTSHNEIFELIINLPTEVDIDKSEFVDKNEKINILKLQEFLLDSDRPVPLLEMTREQIGGSSGDLDDVPRYTADGAETLEYVQLWVEHLAYQTMNNRINELLRLTDEGMSIQSAFDSILSDIEQRDALHDKVPFDDLENKIDELTKQIGYLTSQINELKQENEELKKQLEENNQEELEEKSMKKEIASFVDRNKDPKSYIDRYDSEEGYREWFHENFPDYKSIHEAVGMREPVPDWIRNSAQWWSEGMISEDEFVSGIEYLVKQKIIEVD